MPHLCAHILPFVVVVAFMYRTHLISLYAGEFEYIIYLLPQEKGKTRHGKNLPIILSLFLLLHYYSHNIFSVARVEH